MNNLKLNIADVVCHLMQKKRLSVSELASRTNVPQPTIYRIAHGEHQKPHRKTLEALSDFFNISIDQLLGREPIHFSRSHSIPITHLPLLSCKQACKWPHIQISNNEYILFDKPINVDAYALRMPDQSMEPIITKNALLIVDPEKISEHRNFVVVKLHSLNEVVIRQLIKDAGRCYIRPLSQDFNQFEMRMLSTNDLIKGTVIEARLNFEG